jgi:hypothetical protein
MDEWQYLNEDNIPLVFKYLQEAYRRGFIFCDLNIYEYLKRGKTRMFKIEEGCLLLLRKRTIGVYVLKLSVPPISLDGNLELEEKLLKKYLNAGFSCFTNEEFLKEGHDFKVSKSSSNGGAEFIYTRDILNLAGHKYKNQRNLISKYEKLLKEGKIIRKWLNYDPQMDEAYKKWAIQSGFGSTPVFIPYLKMLPENTKILCHYDENGKLFHFQVNLKLTDHLWNAVHTIKDYDYFKELNFGWLGDYILMQEYSEIEYLSVGATHKGQKELFFSKSRLPHIYKQKATIRYRTTTKEDYAQVIQPTNNLFGESSLF